MRESNHDRQTIINRIFHSASNAIQRLWNVGVIPMFLSIVFVQGLTLVTQFVVARLLPVEEFGVVRVVEVFLAIGMVPAGLGMTSVIVKEIAEQQDSRARGRILFHALVLTGVFSVFVSLVLQIVIPRLGFSQQVSDYLLLLVFLFMPLNVSRTAISYFMGLKQIQRVVWINVLFSFIAFLLVIVGSVIDSLTGWAWGRILGQILFVAVILWVVRGAIIVSLESRLFRSLARLGVWVALAFIVDSIASSADVLYLEQMLNDTRQIGYYGIAGIIITGCLLGASAVSAVAFPYFSEHNANPQEQFKIARRIILRIFAFMLPITLALYIFAPLLPLFLGESYRESIELLRMLSWGLIPAAQILLLATWLFAIGRPEASVVVSVIAIAINFGLIRLLVPMMGINGAAVAYVITTIARMALLGVALAWIYRRSLFQRSAIEQKTTESELN